MYDILLTAMLSTLFGAAVIVAIVKWPSLAKKKKPKQLCVEQVLKEADQALAFDPLEEARKKPEAIKPLLSVLLEIREKKAEQELREEERRRVYGPPYRRVIEPSCVKQERKIAADLLSGIVGPDHPHYPFTEAGRQAAAQLAAQQDMSRALGLSAYEQAPRYDVPADQYIMRKPRGHTGPYGT